MRSLAAYLAVAVLVAACETMTVSMPTTPLSSGVVPIEPAFESEPAKVEVTTAERWKQGKNDAAPAKGNVYVSLLVEITALSAADYSPYYATLRTADGFEYDWMVIPRREPSLGSGELAPGDSVKGWITFEVPKDATADMRFIWKSIFADQVVVPISI